MSEKDIAKGRLEGGMSQRELSKKLLADCRRALEKRINHLLEGNSLPAPGSTSHMISEMWATIKPEDEEAGRLAKEVAELVAPSDPLSALERHEQALELTKRALE